MEGKSFLGTDNGYMCGETNTLGMIEERTDVAEMGEGGRGQGRWPFMGLPFPSPPPKWSNGHAGGMADNRIKAPP
jgi:hypothetical protein